MSRAFDTYQTDLYSVFKEIEQTAYRDIISFYEGHELSFLHLDHFQLLEIQIAYASALFEVGRYLDFLVINDELLESIIFHNIKLFKGEDVFEKLIFKKAAAHYQLCEFERCEKILWELIKMNPENTVASYLLKRCIIKNQPRFLKRSKSVSIVLFLAAAGIIAIELLVIRPFFDRYSYGVEIIRTSIFLAGILVLILADGWHRVKTFHYVNRKTADLRRY
ncbi:MAG: hypothetical protein OEQ53_15310 [Saprospiraceae bacterium]|nr:hypothetical protein [Saprospiraceae bacterium]